MRTLFGWLILIAALAVPAGLFWNWRSKVNAESASMQAKGKRPSETIFGGVSSSGKRAAPPSASTAAAAPGLRVSTEAAGASSRPAASESSSIGIGSKTEELAVALQFNPKTERDPMLSKEERDRLDEASRPKPIPVAQETHRIRPEDKIVLQGIVKTPYGITALINDAVWHEGDRIEGIMVYRITTKMVVFKYGSKTFVKTLTK